VVVCGSVAVTCQVSLYELNASAAHLQTIVVWQAVKLKSRLIANHDRADVSDGFLLRSPIGIATQNTGVLSCFCHALA
jgi:hypothetical protein